MRQVRNALAALENFVKAAVLIKVRRVKGQAARRIARHGLEKGCLLFVARIANASPYPVSLVQKLAHDPAADKSCAAGYSNCSALWYWRHRFSPCYFFRLFLSTTVERVYIGSSIRTPNVFVGVVTGNFNDLRRPFSAAMEFAEPGASSIRLSRLPSRSFLCWNLRACLAYPA